MALTDIMIKKTKPQDKVFFLSDGRGLMLEIRPSGGKSWIARLRLNGKEKRKVIGQYPDVSIAEAREEFLKLKKQAKTGSLVSVDKASSFLSVYDEWYRVKIAPLSENYSEKIKLQMSKHAIPVLGKVRSAKRRLGSCWLRISAISLRASQLRFFALAAFLNPLIIFLVSLRVFS